MSDFRRVCIPLLQIWFNAGLIGYSLTQSESANSDTVTHESEANLKWMTKMSFSCCVGGTKETAASPLSLIVCCAQWSMMRLSKGGTRCVLTACAALALVLAAGYGSAQAAGTTTLPANSPVGRWKTIDDKTGKVKSIVVIGEQNGALSGTIEQLFDPPVPKPTCYLCSGDLKDKPLVGLRVLWGFRVDGSGWSGGQVLDPETGKIYRASMALEDGGKQLRLRGYIGIPLLGRTERWVRVE
jgi:uncharacterized protein (DUF2147 family)